MVTKSHSYSFHWTSLVTLLLFLMSCGKNLSIINDESVSTAASVEYSETDDAHDFSNRLDSLQEELLVQKSIFSSIVEAESGERIAFYDVTELWGYQYRVEIVREESAQSVYVSRLDFLDETKSQVGKRVKVDLKSIKGISIGEDANLEFNAWNSLTEFELLIESQVYRIELPEEVLSKVEDDCPFDLSNQTDDFIKDVPEFSDYVWNSSTKEATIKLPNGDVLIAQRGGCSHFGLSGTLISTDSTPLSNEDYWRKKVLWIAKRIFDETDYSFLVYSLESKSYEKGDEPYSYYFPHEYYSSFSITMTTKDGKVELYVGYYFA